MRRLLFLIPLLSLSACMMRPGTSPAVARRTAEMAATSLAINTATSFDPTGLSRIPASHLQRQIMDGSNRRMLDESLASLPPDERELMKKYMNGEISEAEFKKQFLDRYGVDEDGNLLGEKEG